jgi:hypothetical protein
VWYPKRDPKAPPFGNFNGLNLVGLDPAAFFRAYAADRKLNFAEYVAGQPIAFTVVIRKRTFPWLTMHPEQTQSGATQVIGYEVGVTAWGLPVKVCPAGPTDRRRTPAIGRVNEAELTRSNCRGLVRRGRRGWELSERGREWAELLTYNP